MSDFIVCAVGSISVFWLMANSVLHTRTEPVRVEGPSDRIVTASLKGMGQYDRLGK